MKLIMVVILLVGALSLTDSIILKEKGSGITDDQLTQINTIIASARKLYGTELYEAAVYIKSQIQKYYGQYWVVEIVTGTNLTHGISGGKIDSDQWLTLVHQSGFAFFWIYVPEFNQIQTETIAGLDIAIIKGKLGQSYKNLQTKGSGISDGQQTAIQNFMRNAELSKGNHPKACATYIEQKLQDSYGQNWVVEIYGAHDLNWGREKLTFKNDQWLFYNYQGQFFWQYLIWVPGY